MGVSMRGEAALKARHHLVIPISWLNMSAELRKTGTIINPLMLSLHPKP